MDCRATITISSFESWADFENSELATEDPSNVEDINNTTGDGRSSSSSSSSKYMRLVGNVVVSLVVLGFMKHFVDTVVGTPGSRGEDGLTEWHARSEGWSNDTRTSLRAFRTA